MRYLLPLALALCLIGCATPQREAHRTSRVGQKLTVRTTAYTQTEAGGSKNAIGGRLHFGGPEYSAASDWSWLPLGTRFKLLSNGHEYLIEDYGSALVGKKTIDLYMPTRAAMHAWGARNVDIEILQWGSSVMSLKMLEPRQKADYVRTMVTCLRRNGPLIASSRETRLPSGTVLP